MFVQIALRSTNYCVSTFEAFKILITNPLKISITGLISYIVLFFGVVFIVAGICTAAYFVQIEVPYFAEVLTDPIPMTVIGGIITVIVAGVFLSVLVDSA